MLRTMTLPSGSSVSHYFAPPPNDTGNSALFGQPGQFANAFGQAMQGFGQGISGLGQGLGQGLGGIGQGMGQAASGMFNAYGGLGSNLAGAAAQHSGALSGLGTAQANNYNAYAGGLTGIGNAMANERTAAYGAMAQSEAARQLAAGNIANQALASYGSLGNAAMAAWAQNQSAYNQALANMMGSNQNAVSQLGQSQNQALGQLGSSTQSALGGIGQARAAGLSQLGMAGASGLSQLDASGQNARASLGQSNQGAMANISQGRSASLAGLGQSYAGLGGSLGQSARTESERADRTSSVDLGGLGGIGSGGGSFTAVGPSSPIASGSFGSIAGLGGGGAGGGGSRVDSSSAFRGPGEFFPGVSSASFGGLARTGQDIMDQRDSALLSAMYSAGLGSLDGSLREGRDALGGLVSAQSGRLSDGADADTRSVTRALAMGSGDINRGTADNRSALAQANADALRRLDAQHMSSRSEPFTQWGASVSPFMAMAEQGYGNLRSGMDDLYSQVNANRADFSPYLTAMQSGFGESSGALRDLGDRMSNDFRGGIRDAMSVLPYMQEAGRDFYGGMGDVTRGLLEGTQGLGSRLGSGLSSTQRSITDMWNRSLGRLPIFQKQAARNTRRPTSGRARAPTNPLYHAQMAARLG